MRILCTLLFALTAYCTNAQTQNGVVKGTGPDGSPEEKTYRKGVLKGPYKSFYADQKLRIKGQYDNNLRTGQWKYYKYTDTNIPYVFQFNTYENDTLNGPFMLMTNDTITEGNYAGNLLNGPWKQYKLAIASSGDSMRSMIAVGEFREGVKAGHWKLYNEHGISKEGDYFLGQMSGQWKTYGAYTSPPKVMIESRYRKGKKDGREIQYFEYKSVPIPCKNPNARNCFDHKKVNIRREAIYNQGKLQGPYTVKGPDGKLLAKGEYIDGEKVGKWQEWNDEYRMMMYANYFDGRLAGPVTFQNEQGKTMISGSYNDNIKNSKWVWYRNDGTVE
ncbi:MAG: toxin-antitoxin system YwqK family antitoxin, partial [Flavobacteriales bacterium]